MNYNNYYKNKEIIIIPKNNDKPIFKNNINIKPKNNTYENIREIVLENKNENVKKDLNNIEKPKTKGLKQNIV
jgi:hypothetical protein